MDRLGNGLNCRADCQSRVSGEHRAGDTSDGSHFCHRTIVLGAVDSFSNRVKLTDATSRVNSMGKIE